MSDVGRRVKLTRHIGGGREYGATTGKSIRRKSVCGLEGDYGTVVSVDDRLDGVKTFYIIVNYCDCDKVFGNGNACDGTSINSHFVWADDAPKNDGLCNCDWGIVMTIGCTCGGK